MHRRPVLLLACATLAAGLPACGGDDDNDDGGSGTGTTQAAGPTSAKIRADVRGATRATASDFPATDGRTLQQVADTIRTGPTVGLASSNFTPGRNRLAFGVIDDNQNFVYAPSAVYVAPTPSDPATGPFPAPADVLITDPPFRSRQAATEDDAFAAVYSATIPIARAGKLAVLVVSKTSQGMLGAATEIKARPVTRDPVPRVGEKAPRVATDTLSSLSGNEELLDTRLPPSDMHASSFADVLGKRPVALLFATPQLCQSRVCGPVVDVALQLKEKYGNRVELIHQEVYEDNDLQKGFRKPLEAFGLTTEPWLFTVKADGTIAARLEGSFGFDAFEKAIRAAL